MKLIRLHIQLLIFLLTLSFAFLNNGCATVTVMTEWKEIPKDRPIQVAMNSGERFEFDQWTLKPDSLLIGWTKSAQTRIPSTIGLVKLPQQCLYIPTAEINTIASIDNTQVNYFKTCILVVGCVSGAIFLYYVFENIPRLPFGRM
jgi:hypothetical protein